MEENTSTKFHGQINLLALFASAGLTVAFLIATYFIYTGVFTLQSGQDNLVLLMFVVLDVFGILFVINIVASFFGYPYIIDREGITIKKDLRRTRIGFSDIAHIRKISSEEAKQIIKEVQEKDKHLYMPNTAPYISEELKNLTKYLTYNPGIGFTSRRRGISVFGVGLRVFTIKILDPLISKRDFVLINLKDDRAHLLSPQSPDLFLKSQNSVEALHRKLNSLAGKITWKPIGKTAADGRAVYKAEAIITLQNNRMHVTSPHWYTSLKLARQGAAQTILEQMDALVEQTMRKTMSPVLETDTLIESPITFEDLLANSINTHPMDFLNMMKSKSLIDRPARIIEGEPGNQTIALEVRWLNGKPISIKSDKYPYKDDDERKIAYTSASRDLLNELLAHREVQIFWSLRLAKAKNKKVGKG